MKGLLRTGLFLLAITQACLADTAALQPTDFAYGLPLEVSGKAAIYRLDLPQSVYQELAGDDYSDLRVFNAAGQVVPHSLRRAQSPVAVAEEAQQLPFFPYTLIEPGKSAAMQVQVTINEQGAIVSSSPSGTAGRTTGQHVSAYLLDVSGLSALPGRIVLEWQSPADSFVARVRLEASNDLNQWHTLVAQTSLVRLTFAGRELLRNEIRLPSGDYKYLKLAWPAQKDAARLTQVRAYVSPVQEAPQPVWIGLQGNTGTDAAMTVFDYRRSSRLPVEWIDVELPDVNSLLDVKLLSRSSEKSDWRQRYSGSFYRLQVEGASLHSEPARLPALHDTYWRLQAVSNLSGFAAAAPFLKLGYAPRQLYFLARGAGPFVLAYGTQRKLPPQEQVNALLSRINADNSEVFIGEVYAGERIILGGAERLQVPPEAFPWQQLLLWSVLSFGVFVLGFIAWRLARQMKEHG